MYCPPVNQKMTKLYHEIYQKVALIPKGHVASYSQVARACGISRGARLVGWALRALPVGTDIPWQRVVNQKGIISIVNPRVPASLQKTLLEEEGVEIIEKEGNFVLANPPWFDLY